jgi:hypothetical protein
MTEPTDIDLSPAESLLFWIVLLLTLFGVTGFCAGLLYPFIGG